MDLVPNELLVFMVRWVHVLAAIMWIGNSFYFMWLDANLEAPERGGDPAVDGFLWMVHSGGFYLVEKRRVGPGTMPKILHWFKWEATFTWLGGFLLLWLLYYLRGGAYLIDPAVADISPAAGIAASLGILSGAWLVYDTFWNSPLGARPVVAVTVSVILTLGLVYGACQLFSGRAAFLHLGAVYGTLMVLNVWIRILPAQRAMIAATERGETPDFELGKRAKRRSTHNSYMTFPVLFAMLSNHVPAAYSHSYNWVILILTVLLGMAIRHVMILHTKHQSVKLWFAPVAALAAMILAVMQYEPRSADLTMDENAHGAVATEVADVGLEEAFAVVQKRCVPCHATRPEDDSFGPTPGGVSFEDRGSLVRLAERVRVRAVETKTMPIMNKTGMTEKERALLNAWTAKVLETRP